MINYKLNIVYLLFIYCIFLQNSNTLLSVAGDDIKPVPNMGQQAEVQECTPLFPGLKGCGHMLYSDAMFEDASPYFPLSGRSK